MMVVDDAESGVVPVAVGAVTGDDADGALVAASSLRFLAAKSRSAKRQTRDDVGRWRKIYYRLRQTNGSEAKIRAAYLLVKDAELRASMNLAPKGAKTTENVRKNLSSSRLSSIVDERTGSAVIKRAMDSARMARRLEALGPDTMVNFSALPQDIQDSLKKYLRHMNLEPRIKKHFGPFAQGKVRRSVKDVLNLVDRTVIDNQVYRKGYDREHGG